jgi:hypothetical protein
MNPQQKVDVAAGANGAKRNVVSLGLVLVYMTLMASAAAFVSRSDVWAHPDAAYYLSMARDLTAGSGDFLVAHHLITYQKLPHPPFDYWQPFLSWLVAGCSFALGSLFGSARFVVWFFDSVALPLAIYFFVRAGKATNLTALSAAVVTLSMPRIQDFQSLLDTVIPTATFVTAGAAFLVVEYDRPRRGAAAIGGILLGLAAITRSDALIVSLAILATFVLLGDFSTWRSKIVAIGGFLLASSPVIVRNAIVFGSPFGPASAQVPGLTSYWGLLAFGARPTPHLMDFIAIRINGLFSAKYVFDMWPLVTLGLAATVALLIVRLQGQRLTRPDSSTMACLLSLIAFGVFVLAGALLAPAVTQWTFRAPVPYVPIVIAAGAISLEELGKTGVSQRWRAGAILLLAAAVVPNVILNPSRFATAGAHLDDGHVKAAAALVTSTARVMTNAPIEFYLWHGPPGVVVAMPSNGEAAVAEAIKHYDVTDLVLIRNRRSTDPHEFADDAIDEIWAGRKATIGPFRLEELSRNDEFLIARIAGDNVPR